LKTVFAALHENDSETFSKKLKRIKTKIFIPKTSYENQRPYRGTSLRGTTPARPGIEQQPDRADDKDAHHHDMAVQKARDIEHHLCRPLLHIRPVQCNTRGLEALSGNPS